MVISGERAGEDKFGDCDRYKYTTKYKIDSKNLWYSTGNSVLHSVMTYMDTESLSIYLTDSLHCTAETNITL